MTSRVQKGNAIFRPVAKSRARPAARAPTIGPSDDVSVADSLTPSTTEGANISTPGPPPIALSTPSRSIPTPIFVSRTPAPPTSNISIDRAPSVIPAVQRRRSPPPVQSQDTSSQPSAATRAPVVNSETDVVEGTRSVSLEDIQPDESASTNPQAPVEEATANRKRKQSASMAPSDDTPKSRQKRSKKSPSTGPRGSRGRSLPPYDPAADPGEDLDPTIMTMAEICSDTGQGRVSSKAVEIQTNHVAWKARNREKRARMRALMERKKYGKEGEDDEDEPTESTPSTSAPVAPTAVTENTEGFDYSQNLSSSRYNVQIRIGPNGEAVVDEDSLVVDRTEHINTDGYAHVVESDHTKFVNSGTYGKRFRGSRWSADETELFYDYGENYELIAYVLPGRDRKSCKNKFKAEDKKNHDRIEYCLRNSVPVDMKTLARMTGKDFSGPVPEIRAPNPNPTTDKPPESIEPTHDEVPDVPTTRKRKSKRGPAPTDDTGIIVGDADQFEP
ncbi:hypothetical protein BDN72DRAFT_39066 [Pluteus cervinus]|uniref:Uncharacterized protein n=1 Tax=Pluteus cervinus TaxID=181527 RepID=A0ACD3BI89_9AGAR|nr:hypothetical protein BDN72DRAFT_39066 [Pluteus cervinus]